MEHYSVHLLFFTTLFFLLVSDFVALDTISPNQAIQDGETIVSQGEMYELGFFSPGNTKRRYVGIWYKKISKGTVVWVANRETPIHDTSGMFKLCGDGNLVILGGDNTVIWSSYSTVSVSVGSNDFVAQLLDSGNLVVRDKSRTRTDQNVLWESFDYPGDTLLPGMKFGKDLVTGLERFMSSWKSPDDPSCGVYNHILDTSGYPQIFGRRGSVLLSRLGPWTGVRFSGFATEIPNPIFSAEFVLNEKEIYHKYELVSSVVERRILTWDGKIIILRWIDRKQDWVVYADTGGDTTCSFELCGPYGVCSINKHPPCSCMQGFEPKFPQEWEASDWSNGCHHKKRSDSGNQYGFQKISGIKLPDTRFSWYNHNMTLGECEMMCRRNFSCTAYSNLDTRNGGSGCLLWFKELMDAREYDTEDHNIYIRMVASELAVERHQSNSIRWKGVLTAVLSISSAGLVMFSVAYACRKREKRLQMKKKDLEYALGKKNSSEQTQLLDDTPFIPLYKVAKATNDFSVSNKIGEGGFGPVYKGVLEDGQEVAVKRLSDTSQQGIDEFRNELASIAKLQHRNLVKLLGYCINGNEMVLIYEYMANKSLDSFIFDETRSSMLVWPQRFQIILGMARGILYLHQDSRFQIVHRDLKAGNILLDGDMNPKISDFGLARMFVGHDTTAKTKKVVGTYGYISPEYAVHGRFSIKSDVFSFGVLVLEIISGKKNREFSHEDHNDNLLGHAWRLYKDNNSIQLMSACLRASCVVPEVLRSIHVGLLCVQNHAKDRPTMLSVLLMLLIEGVLPEPKQPAFFTEENREINYVSPLDEEMITRLHPR